MEHKKVVVFGHDSDKKTAVTRAVGCGHTVTVYWRKKKQPFLISVMLPTLTWFFFYVLKTVTISTHVRRVFHWSGIEK